MTLWDGLTSSDTSGKPAQIVVLGATNRIHDIDEAILRRMPKKFPVPLPGREQRKRILQLILQNTKTDPEDFDIDYVAKITAGMSGSDIKEACRDAAMAPVREYMREHRTQGRAMVPVDPHLFRGIRSDDFIARRAAQPDGRAQRRHSTMAPTRRPASGDEYEDADELVAEPQD
jgi:SpoVK/Ycf46/Vps4 family AAA+-type ATPase